MDHVGFQNILVLLAVAVILVAIFRYLHLPQVLAYLCAGVVVGPYGLSWIPDVQGTRYLAEFGLVFLMFTIGLEFSLPKLLALRKMVLGLGGAQVFISCVAFGLAAWAWGASVQSAIVIGGVLSLSSTAIVMKLLVEQLEQHSRHGQHAFSVLLFQDLIFVPFLILIPALAGDTQDSVVVALGWALVKSVIVLVVILFIGRWLLRPLLHEVASARSREFFMLTVLLLTLSAAWLTHIAGLSLALGAFLAGMMLAESEYRHQVEADILPFRDVLLGLFFVTVGMLLNLEVLVQLWHWVVLCLFAIVIFKLVLITLLGKLFRMETGVALRTGLVLAQGGEFGFALMVQAQYFGMLVGEAAQIVLSAIVLSMAVAPLIVRYNGLLAKLLVPGYSQTQTSNLEAIRSQLGDFENHVIICGYGRSGQNLAWMLEQEGMPSLALDLDPVRVRDARDAGKPVAYGDVTRREVLQAAGLEYAAALTVSFNDVPAALRILEITRDLRPDMPVIVRTMDDADLERLYAADATVVVPESLEGSMMIGSHLLLLLGVPISHVIAQVRQARGERYHMLRGYFHGQDLDVGDDTSAYHERLHSVSLPAGAYAVGRTIQDIDLERAQVQVTAVRRGGIHGPKPVSSTHLRAGDVLVLYGAPEALEQAEKLLLQGG